MKSNQRFKHESIFYFTQYLIDFEWSSINVWVKFKNVHSWMNSACTKVHTKLSFLYFLHAKKNKKKSKFSKRNKY